MPAAPSENERGSHASYTAADDHYISIARGTNRHDNLHQQDTNTTTTVPLPKDSVTPVHCTAKIALFPHLNEHFAECSGSAHMGGTDPPIYCCPCKCSARSRRAF